MSPEAEQWFDGLSKSKRAWYLLKNILFWIPASWAFVLMGGLGLLIEGEYLKVKRRSGAKPSAGSYVRNSPISPL